MNITDLTHGDHIYLEKNIDINEGVFTKGRYIVKVNAQGKIFITRLGWDLCLQDYMDQRTGKLPSYMTKVEKKPPETEETPRFEYSYTAHHTIWDNKLRMPFGTLDEPFFAYKDADTAKIVANALNILDGEQPLQTFAGGEAILNTEEAIIPLKRKPIKFMVTIGYNNPQTGDASSLMTVAVPYDLNTEEGFNGFMKCYTVNKEQPAILYTQKFGGLGV